ncbi:MAG: acyltransferase family protein [Pseudomonadota bacterium]
MAAKRVLWLDYAKAMSIALVVMMHSVRGVGEAMGGEGFMHALVAFSDPFRIPAFFLLAGLLAGRAVAKSWPVLLDRKVAFYAYFYVLWVTIQFAFKAPLALDDFGLSSVAQAYALAMINPDTTLWFIAVLPVYFVIAKLTKNMPVTIVLAAAFLIMAATIETGWNLIDAGCNGLFFFLLGQRASQQVFEGAERLRGFGVWTAAFVGVWIVAASLLLDFAILPGIAVVFALAGAGGLIGIAVLLERLPLLGWLRWIGQNTLVIYLAFFLPMAVTRIGLVGIGIIDNIGLVSLIVWLAAMIGPVILYFAVEKIGFGQFLFKRPAWASTYKPRTGAAQAAE